MVHPRDESLRQEVAELSRRQFESQRHMAEQQRMLELYAQQASEMRQYVDSIRRPHELPSEPEVVEDEPDDQVDAWADQMVQRMQEGERLFVPPPPPARPPQIPLTSLRRPGRIEVETGNQSAQQQQRVSVKSYCQLTERDLVEPRQWPHFHDPILLRDKLEAHFTKSVTGQPRQEMYALLRMLPSVVDSVLAASEEHGGGSRVFEHACVVADNLVLEFTRKRLFCLVGKKGLDEFEHGLAMVEADLPTATKMAHAICAKLASFQEPARTVPPAVSGASGTTKTDRQPAYEPKTTTNLQTANRKTSDHKKSEAVVPAKAGGKTPGKQ